MKLLFLSAEELDDAEYVEGDLGLILKTKYGAADTLGFCGMVESMGESEFTLADPGHVKVCSAPGLASQLREGSHVLVYGKPVLRDGLCVNISRDDGIIPVGEETCRRFHEIRKKADKYLLEHPTEETEEEGFTLSSRDEEILDYIEKNDLGDGVDIDVILENFKKVEGAYDRLLDLMEAGELYEPTAGRLKVLR